MSMLYEVGQEVQTAIRARGCPLPVVYTESTKTATFGRERIVFEHDEGGDSFSSVKAQRTTPKHVVTRTVGARLTIYVQSARAGAMRFEHERRAEAVLDVVLVALHEVASKRRNTLEIRGGRFLLPEDLQGSESPGGAVYQLEFSIDRGVYDKTFAGAVAPTVTVGPGGIIIRSRTEAGLAFAPDDTPPETGCGG